MIALARKVNIWQENGMEEWLANMNREAGRIGVISMPTNKGPDDGGNK